MKLAARTGTDDEIVDELVSLLENICSAVDDAEEDMGEAKDRNRKGDRDLVQAGQFIGDRAMRRSRKKANTTGRRSQSDTAKSSDDSDDDSNQDQDVARRLESPTGGPAPVTPKSAARRKKP